MYFAKGTFTLDAHSIRIGIHIVRIRIECALIAFILHFELRGITTFPHDLRGMKTAPADTIVVLALVFCLNYVRLCWKHQSDRRREINRRRHQSRIRRQVGSEHWPLPIS